MNAIECHQVTRRYDQTTALENISLQVPPGSIYGFLGRNGAGKTTLLRMLAGLMWPNNGEIRVLGKNPREFSVEDRQKIGFLSEKQILPPNQKVGSLIEFCKTLYPTWDDSIVKRLIQNFSLDRGKKVSELSNGQQRQVAFLLAIAFRPQVLILDEPASTLDVVARREFLDEILGLIREEGRTVFFSTHILSDLERVADRIGILKKGQLIADESLDSLKENVLQVRWISSENRFPELSGWQIYRSTKQNQEWKTVLRLSENRTLETLEQKARESGCQIQIDSLSLEELFVQIVGGES